MEREPPELVLGGAGGGIGGSSTDQWLFWSGVFSQEFQEEGLFEVVVVVVVVVPVLENREGEELA